MPLKLGVLENCYKLRMLTFYSMPISSTAFRNGKSVHRQSADGERKGSARRRDTTSKECTMRATWNKNWRNAEKVGTGRKRMKRGRGLYIDIRKTRVKHFVTKERGIETSLFLDSLLCLLLHLPTEESICLNEQRKLLCPHCITCYCTLTFTNESAAVLTLE